MSDIEYLKKYYKGNIDDAIIKLKKGIPVQYIVGEVDFYGNILKINSDVLIPRFETERLVELTIQYLKEMFNHKINIVDLGCGSGCIAISLKKNINACVTGVDISSKALKVAKKNALNNNVDIDFIQGDMLNPLTKKYDCIISNPPYISYDEEIMDIVKNNEPHLALYADNNGLYYYETILKNCHKYLNDKFLIALEIGQTQGKIVKELALKYLGDVIVIIKQDMQGLDRFVFITNNN